MRPRRLEVSAIGPFGGTVEVDFDQLSTLGVFHIHGNTGAGKTSLLDAMSFALYGRGTGSRASDGIRSQHAAPHAEAVATLEFSAQDHEWRIVRKPPQERAKKRGDGTVKSSHQNVQLLKWVSGEWKPYLSSVTEIDAEVRKLVGLDHVQFNQVVVLPQGGFERVLKAGTKERRSLLRTLFGTLRFEQYSEELAERARVLKDGHVEADQRVKEIRARIVRCASDADLDVQEEVSPSTVESLVSQAKASVVVAQDDVDGARLEQSQARARVADGQSAAERHQRRVGALSSLRALAEQEDEIVAIELELANARLVAPAVPALHRLQTTKQRAASAAKELEQSQAVVKAHLNEALRDDVLSAVEPLGRIGIDDPALRTALSDALASVDAQHQRAAQVQAALVEAKRLRADAEKYKETEAGIATQLSTANEKRSEAIEHLEQERLVAGQLELAVDRRHVMEQRLAALESLVVAKETASRNRELLRDAEVARTDAVESLNTLLELRMANMAGELASLLKNSEPCPVCGGCEHPMPSRPAQVIGDEDIDSARRVVTDRELEVASARSDHESAVADQTRLQTIAGPEEDIEVVRAAVSAAKKSESEARKAASRLESIEEALTNLDAGMVDLTSQLEDARRKAIESQTAADAHATHLDTGGVDETHIVQLSASLERAAATLRQLISQAEALSGAVAANQDANRALLADEAHLQTIAAESGLTDISVIADYARRTEDVDHLYRLASEWRQKKAGAEQVLAQPDVANASEAPDLVSLERALATADEQVQASLAHLHDRQQRARELSVLHGELRAAADRVGPAMERWERVQQLADMCRGVYVPNKMSLESYVLAAHLERVAVAASRRLELMTDGRFSLRHSDARTGAGASGLSLMVRDSYTGLEREVSTLSGGETFLASMALALGLSDVVQQHAGGVHIDVLFIDEGFGTLDAERLELAMAHLEHVRASGRVIGLISHVPALKERVPTGIEVVEGRNGSDVRLLGAPEEMSA